MAEYDSEEVRYPVVLYRLADEDPEFAMGLKFYIETLDMDRFYGYSREAVDEFCNRHGLVYITEADMARLREALK